MNTDLTAEERKKDHIELAFASHVNRSELDHRFAYEPMLAGHPPEVMDISSPFGKKQLKAPIWISSMTGGTARAGHINRNLAKMCGEFGLGMGLGSCRSLLESDDHLEDFAIRHLIGSAYPFYANLGIAQLEQLLELQQLKKISDLISKLDADGLIIHVNPMQEWLQPEGDVIIHPPIETIRRLIDDSPNLSIIVKEVGQGFGKASLKALLELPLVAVEFAAAGGTNFSKLELKRSSTKKQEIYNTLCKIGHSAEEMVELTNELIDELGPKRRCNQVIVSGGIKQFLDGYYLTEKCKCPAIYGQASAFLKHAQDDYSALQAYASSQIEGLKVAKTFLRIR